MAIDASTSDEPPDQADLASGKLRWISQTGEYAERPDVTAFLNDIIDVCRKHGLSLSHEDRHGTFEVDDFDQAYVDWLIEAFDVREQEPSPEIGTNGK